MLIQSNELAHRHQEYDMRVKEFEQGFLTELALPVVRAII